MSAIVKDPPTARQVEVLQLIDAGRKKNGHPPTFAEIASSLCVTSIHTVVCHLEPLKRRGLVTWVPRKGRTLAITPAGRAWLPPEAA